MPKSRILHLDFETFSECNLKVHGLDRYASHPTTEVLMLAWAIDNEPVQLWIVPQIPPEIECAYSALDDMPAELYAALIDPHTLKYAHNAQFERAILKHVLRIDTPAREWRCTMVMAYMLGLPGSLGELGPVIGLNADQAKMKDGYRLIRRFCVPQKPTKARPFVRATAETDPEDWALFCDYCRRDVEAEQRVHKKLAQFPVPAIEWQRWALDQEINERGMPIDARFVEAALEVYDREVKRLIARMKVHTRLANPASPSQLLPWLQARGYPFSDLKKDRVAKALADYTWSMDEECVRVLELRQQAARTSIKKYKAMQNAHVRGWLRYAFQFMGASRTGRWAGRMVQLQNLPRPDKAVEEFMQDVRDMIDARELDLIHMIFDRPMNALAASIRSAIKAPHGHKLVVADLSAIESRVLGWVSGCETLLDVFRRGLDTYKAFGVHLFQKDYDDITKAERNLAKPAVLGAGYRLGGGNEVGEYPDVKKTGLWGYAESMGIKMSQDEAYNAVQVFREVYPEVVQFWYDLERATFEAMRSQQPQRVGMLLIDIKAPFLRIRLPSGRYLHYLRPKIENVTMKTKDGPVQRKNLTYEGYDITNKWTRISTHGGKLTENIVQAIARDILAEGMDNAAKAGFHIVGSVHDEIIALEPLNSKLTVEDLENCMTDMPAWANLPLGAEGYEATVYRK